MARDRDELRSEQQVDYDPLKQCIQSKDLHLDQRSQSTSSDYDFNSTKATFTMRTNLFQTSKNNDQRRSEEGSFQDVVDKIKNKYLARVNEGSFFHKKAAKKEKKPYVGETDMNIDEREQSIFHVSRSEELFLIVVNLENLIKEKKIKAPSGNDQKKKHAYDFILEKKRNRGYVKRFPLGFENKCSLMIFNRKALAKIPEANLRAFRKFLSPGSADDEDEESTRRSVKSAFAENENVLVLSEEVVSNIDMQRRVTVLSSIKYQFNFENFQRDLACYELKSSTDNPEEYSKWFGLLMDRLVKVCKNYICTSLVAFLPQNQHLESTLLSKLFHQVSAEEKTEFDKRYPGHFQNRIRCPENQIQSNASSIQGSRSGDAVSLNNRNPDGLFMKFTSKERMIKLERPPAPPLDDEILLFTKLARDYAERKSQWMQQWSRERLLEKLKFYQQEDEKKHTNIANSTEQAGTTWKQFNSIGYTVCTNSMKFFDSCPLNPNFSPETAANTLDLDRQFSHWTFCNPPFDKWRQFVIRMLLAYRDEGCNILFLLPELKVNSLFFDDMGLRDLFFHVSAPGTEAFEGYKTKSRFAVQTLELVQPVDIDKIDRERIRKSANKQFHFIKPEEKVLKKRGRNELDDQTKEIYEDRIREGIQQKMKKKDIISKFNIPIQYYESNISRINNEVKHLLLQPNQGQKIQRRD